MGACHSFTQIRLVGKDVTAVWMQGAAQRKVQAQLGVVGALRGAVAQDELEAENQRLRAELDTERRTRSGRQLLVEPEAPMAGWYNISKEAVTSVLSGAAAGDESLPTNRAGCELPDATPTPMSTGILSTAGRSAQMYGGAGGAGQMQE